MMPCLIGQGGVAGGGHDRVTDDRARMTPRLSALGGGRRGVTNENGEMLV